MVYGESLVTTAFAHHRIVANGHSARIVAFAPIQAFSRYVWVYDIPSIAKGSAPAPKM